MRKCRGLENILKSYDGASHGVVLNCSRDMLISMTKLVFLLSTSFGTLASAYFHDSTQLPIRYVSPSSGASPLEWQKLNSTIGGRLLKGRPFASPCFANNGEDKRSIFDSPACAELREVYLSEGEVNCSLRVYVSLKVHPRADRRSELPGGYINTQWETCQRTSQQCLLDSAERTNFAAVDSPYHCYIGSIPEYFVSI